MHHRCFPTTTHALLERICFSTTLALARDIVCQHRPVMIDRQHAACLRGSLAAVAGDACPACSALLWACCCCCRYCCCCRPQAEEELCRLLEGEPGQAASLTESLVCCCWTAYLLGLV
ncbi:unnamed protein product [Polarella glacialis]|uniref:Uncharacterized protein n=1 Tax=Polarella glacialis TaxID=89957 RepID=A0A813DML4_POLGL|nr:unnamed protein product [Polarella glacialis]